VHKPNRELARLGLLYSGRPMTHFGCQTSNGPNSTHLMDSGGRAVQIVS
jgi:hypothetical protein